MSLGNVLGCFYYAEVDVKVGIYSHIFHANIYSLLQKGLFQQEIGTTTVQFPNFKLELPPQSVSLLLWIQITDLRK